MMRNIQLIAIDMDGTVLNKNHTVSDYTMEVLKEAIDQGIYIVPATGRHRDILPAQISNLSGVSYAITSNGAAVFDMVKNEVISSDCLCVQAAKQCINCLLEYGAYFDLYVDGKSYTSKEQFELLSSKIQTAYLDIIENKMYFTDDLAQFAKDNFSRIEKINIPFLDTSIRTSLNETLRTIEHISLTSSGFNNIEINSATASKASALIKLSRLLHIPQENIMAIGDSGTDITMLKYAGLSVAMRNAIEEVRLAADFVTETNTKDGAAHAIEEFVL